MTEKEKSNDILVIHQNRIIFSSGKGLLTEHSKISAQVTQVLNLFTQKIMGGEKIHFIRFENHRMIFLFSQDEKSEGLVAIVLIPIEKSARHIIPAMNIIIRMLEDFLKGMILDAQNKQLDCFYQILIDPENSQIFVPRTTEGILSALVILTAFAHDMQYSIHRTVSNLHFVNPNDPQTLQTILESSKEGKVLSFVNISGDFDSENLLVMGKDTALRQYFSILPNEQIFDLIGRIFGDQSNAYKMKKLVLNEEAKEIAQSIALLPKSEDDFIRNNILLSTVIHPGKDIIVTMSTPLMQRLKDLSVEAPGGEQIEESFISDLELENLTKKLQEGINQIIDTQMSHETEIDEKQNFYEQESQIYTAEPDAIPHESKEMIPKIKPSISKITVSDELIKLLKQKRESGYSYQLNSTPILLDTAPLALNLSNNQNIPFDESKISLSLYNGKENTFLVHIYTNPTRLSALKDDLEDLSIRIGGESYLREDHVSLEGPLNNCHTAIRALLWLCTVEYLRQVELKLHDLSPRFQIPNEGSILIIPPKRDYIREKIPSKFIEFIEEKQIRIKYEKDALITLGMAHDEILSRITKPLKKGDGVVFIASDNNQEMEEIALFLLHISETCGIGFSRW